MSSEIVTRTGKKVGRRSLDTSSALTILVLCIAFAGLTACGPSVSSVDPPPAAADSIEEPSIVVLISANSEWRALLEVLEHAPELEQSPFGEFFVHQHAGRAVLFFHSGWGKISAAATTQYTIDRWKPELLVNLGTCGGFEGRIGRDDTVLVERTVVYDIIERMGDSAEAVEFYSTSIDLSWVNEPYPTPVRRSVLVSADQDLDPSRLEQLADTYDTVAGDWESGAIAWVAERNATPVLILRAVSDLVSTDGGEAYGNFELFQRRTRVVMKKLFDALPLWLDRWQQRPAHSIDRMPE